MRKKYAVGAMAVIAMIVLIFDTQTALQGAQDGILLCIQTVIPSLFPFFFLSGIINRTFLGYSGKVLRPLGRLCAIPAGAESLLLLGWTGGYPVGAQAIATAYEQGSISKRDAERMLGFCSNAGPAFIFGMAGSVFSQKAAPWALWAVLILSSLLTGMILPNKTYGLCKLAQPQRKKPLEQALKAMASVCGWVVLFRVLITFMQRWILWILHGEYSVMIVGALELTNGVVAIHNLENPVFQFISLAALLSFGGICVGLQTVSVTGKLSCKTYFAGKLLQTVLSIIISILMTLFLFPGK